MSGCINRAQLCGYLGQDPDISFMPSGQKVCKISLATTSSYTDKNSKEKMTYTQWHKVIIFNMLYIDLIEKHTKKGSKIYLEGQIQTRKYKDSSGSDRYITEIVMQNYNSQLAICESNKDYSDISENENSKNYDQEISLLDDEIPF